MSDTPKIKIDLAKLRAAQPKPANAPPSPAALAPPEPSAPAAALAPSAPAATPAPPEPPRPKVESYRPLVDSTARLGSLDKDLDREIEAAMGGMSALDLYGDLSRPQPPPASGEGGQKKGRVVRIHGDDVFVEVPGGRAPGMISLQQFPEGAPAVGSDVDVHIEGYDPANGLLRLTRKGAAQHVDWSSVAEGMIVEARVTEANKGGLTVDVNGIRGFLPISHIELFRVEDLNPYINQRLRCMVTEVNPAERNLVVSRRALLDKEREENREKLWNVLAEGQVYTGVVRSVKDFGAFVDIGGVDGLLHIGEMSWIRVQDAASVVQVGQSVKVVVLKLDRERRKVSLGMKQLQASPWEKVVENYPHGTVVKGKVTRLMEFGAFVELEPGIEGLIHISELAPQRVRRVADIVKAEQEVSVMILTVDPGQRRIGLSLKAALPKEEAPAEAEAEEEEVEVKPPRPRTTPLRGGIGDKVE